MSREFETKIALRNDYFKITDKLSMYVIASVYLLLSLNIPHSYYRDRDVYETHYARNFDLITESYDGYVIYFNEPLFLKLNKFLSGFLTEADVVYAISYAVLVISLYLLVRFSKNYLFFFLGLLIFFFADYLFHFQFVVLRQALATVIFLLVLCLNKDKKVTCSVCFLMSFIHSSFFLVSVLYVSLIYLENKMHYRKLAVLYLFITFFMGFSLLNIAGNLGMRQVYETHILAGVDVGGGAFLLFSGVFVYLLLFYRGAKDHLFKFTLICLACYLSFYFFNPVAGRLMASFFFMILLVLVRTSNFANFVVLVLLLLVSIYIAFSGGIEDMSLNVSYRDYLEQFFSLSFL